MHLELEIFIQDDNSAGVDLSDHEVNLKYFLII